MKKEELKIELEKLGINPSMYDLEGSICNTGTVLFENHKKWEVIHIGDKGNQEIVETFNNEEDACKFILNEFIEYKYMMSSDFKPKSSKRIKKKMIYLM